MRHARPCHPLFWKNNAHATMDCWSSSTTIIKLRFQRSAFFLNTRRVLSKWRRFWACVRPFKILIQHAYVLRFSEMNMGAYNASADWCRCYYKAPVLERCFLHQHPLSWITKTQPFLSMTAFKNASRGK